MNKIIATYINGMFFFSKPGFSNTNTKWEFSFNISKEISQITKSNYDKQLEFIGNVFDFILCSV